MSFRNLFTWTRPDPVQDARYAALDLELSSKEAFRVDSADGVGALCGQLSPELWQCSRQDEHKRHMAWDCRGDLVAVWEDRHG